MATRSRCNPLSHESRQRRLGDVDRGPQFDDADTQADQIGEQSRLIVRVTGELKNDRIVIAAEFDSSDGWLLGQPGHRSFALIRCQNDQAQRANRFAAAQQEIDRSG
jgi:hypothetical protein